MFLDTSAVKFLVEISHIMAGHAKENKVALVTGGYKGIGLAIVKSLASQGVTTIFTSRNESLGKKAVKALEEEHQLKTFHHCLDVLDPDSIAKLADWVKQRFLDIDIIINNAAIYGPQTGDLPTLKRAIKIVETNYYGASRVLDAFFARKLLNPGACIVNVSSGAGSLQFLQGRAAAAWKSKLLDPNSLSEETIDSFIHAFYKAAGQGAEILKEEGWPTTDVPIPGYPVDDMTDYCVSKMALNAYTVILAKKYPESLVNSMCPGFCNTDMSLHCGQSPEEGADTAVWLALECESSGKFFVQRKEVADLERIPLVCNGEVATTPESIGQMLFPHYVQRAKSLGLKC